MDQLIKQYFLQGYTYAEITSTLNHIHQIRISIRQLNRVLRRLGLFRRNNQVEPDTALRLIEDKLNGSDSCFGYRLMHHKLRSEGVNIDRESVRLSLKLLDPEGVNRRSCHRFKRRKYISKGPNYLWHMDGYDKLKPFGIAIHGAIDGYSRKILWLEVGASNNNPKIIASYFLKTVNHLKLFPRCIRADRGSENSIVGGIQMFFKETSTNETGTDMCFRYGPSTRNQRIESWWSIFRRNRCSWWINFFKDLCDESIFDPSIPYHQEFLRFCFVTLLQVELDETKNLWNSHYIRKSRNAEAPPGRPNVLYFTPHLSNGEDFKNPINDLDLNIAKEKSEEPLTFGCRHDASDFAFLVMNEH